LLTGCPDQGRELDGLEAPPRSPPIDDLGLVEACFGEGIVIRVVANAADGGLDARLRQMLGVADADVLRSAIRITHETPR
jgi:hypothetical protein